MNQKAKLSDIAKHAGVSQAAVSRFLNGSLEVRDETRLRIETAIDELQYIPNQVARSLRTQTTRSVGIVLPNIENPLFAAISTGIEERLRQEGYSMMVLINKNDLDLERKCVESLLGQSVDGVIFIGYPNKLNLDQDDGYIRKLLNTGIGVVFVNRSFSDQSARAGISSVNSNYAQGAREAIHYLVSGGRRRFAAIMGNWNHPHSREKLLGYQEALREHDLELAPGCLEEGKYDFDQAYRAAQKLLKARPDAILVANDLMAIACMKALGDQRIAVPGDVAVIGYGDTILCKMATPELSSINQDAYQLGYQGGELLLQKIKTKAISHATILLPTRFVPRQSS
ncbi:MAG: LacI family DNA-binding transcriptional regulator [Bacillota bacterium]